MREEVGQDVEVAADIEVAELVERDMKADSLTLSSTFFPVLTKEELEKIWQTPQLT